ncbi:hypothetical protein ACHAPB_000625 [Verticillium nonalfalfae]
MTRVSVYSAALVAFVAADQCTGERSFCSMWRTVGFLASFATILQLATIVSFLVIMVGGRFKREVGWKLLGLMLVVVGLFEFSIMGIVVSDISGKLDA